MAKDTVENTSSLDVLNFKHNDYLSYPAALPSALTCARLSEIQASLSWMLEGNYDKPSSMRLTYTATHFSENRACDYSIQLTQTRCHYGGSRWWFVCPLTVNGERCQRRCRFLYLPFGGNYFGC